MSLDLLAWSSSNGTGYKEQEKKSYCFCQTDNCKEVIISCETAPTISCTLL